jgi:hypothetical protein
MPPSGPKNTPYGLSGAIAAANFVQFIFGALIVCPLVESL